MFLQRQCCSFLLLVFSLLSVAASTKAPPQASFEGSPAWQKLDLRFQNAWRNEGPSKRVAECILKAAAPLGVAQRQQLKQAGFNARSEVGAIVTGSLAMKDLPPMANLEFIKVMELAVPLSPK